MTRASRNGFARACTCASGGAPKAMICNNAVKITAFMQS